MSAETAENEALVVAIVEAADWTSPEGWDRAGRIAECVLTSDWLAAHDAAVRHAEKERIAEALHVERFAHDDRKWGGPDNFYNGMLYAARIARADASSPEVTP